MLVTVALVITKVRFGKKFYKKHTLSGEFNYKRNVSRFYGYDTTENKLDRKIIQSNVISYLSQLLNCKVIILIVQN
jgi:hypothetical protein